jgi:hypothetical protein
MRAEPRRSRHGAARARAGRALLLVAALALAAGALALAWVLGRGSSDGPSSAAGPAAPAAATGSGGDARAADSARVALHSQVRAERPAAQAQEQEPTAQRETRPGSRSEADFLAELSALARSDPPAFAARAESVLTGAGPACEQVALLRAAYEQHLPDAPALFARAVATLPVTSRPGAESVPVTALHWLQARAVRERPARDALAEVAWSARWSASVGLRAQAVRTLALASPDAELAAVRARILSEHDRDVYESGCAALEERAQAPGSGGESQDGGQ